MKTIIVLTVMLGSIACAQGQGGYGQALMRDSNGVALPLPGKYLGGEFVGTMNAVEGKVTIGEGDTVSVYVPGLDTSDVVQVGYRDNEFIAPDTLATWWIPIADTLRIRGKFNKVVGYTVGRKF